MRNIALFLSLSSVFSHRPTIVFLLLAPSNGCWLKPLLGWLSDARFCSIF